MDCSTHLSGSGWRGRNSLIFLIFVLLSTNLSYCSASQTPEFDVNSLTKLEKNTLATWRSAMKLEKDGDLAITILEITSFMANERIPIPIGFLLNLDNVIPDTTEDMLINGIRLLLQFSLMEQNDPGYLEIKSIIQTVVRVTVINRESTILKAMQLVELAVQAEVNFDKKMKLLKHSSAIVSHAMQYDAILKKLPEVPGQTAWKLIMLHQFRDGLDLADRIVSKYIMLFGKNSKWTLDSRRSIAWGYYMLQLTQESMDILEDVYPKSLKHFGEKDWLTLIAASDLASVFQAMGKYEMAIKLYDMLIPVYRSENSTRSLITVKFNKANCLSESGNHKSALELYGTVHKLQVETLGETSEDAFKTKVRISGTLLQAGEFTKGQNLLKETFEVMKTVLGESHPLTKETAQSLTKIKASSANNDPSKTQEKGKLSETSKTEL